MKWLETQFKALQGVVTSIFLMFSMTVVAFLAACHLLEWKFDINLLKIF